MITPASEPVQCPICASLLPHPSKFRLFGRADATVYACKACDKIVLSWRLFIKPREVWEDSVVFPAHERIDKRFISRVQKLSEEGLSTFNRHETLILTDEQFAQYRESFRFLGEAEIAVVIGAYRSHAGGAPRETS